jgi:hypothetical protein
VAILPAYTTELRVGAQTLRWGAKMAIEGKVVYFPTLGSENTENVLRIVKTRAGELGIENIIVASTTGSTAVKATELFKGLRIIAVSHFAGFREPDTQEFSEENKQRIEINGGVVLTATHAFSGLSRAMRKKLNMYLFEEVVANTLRIFGQGMKVACEITLMAADAGLARTDEDIIAIGGSGRGADTALVLRPVNSQDFFDLRVKEILCKPHF